MAEWLKNLLKNPLRNLLGALLLAATLLPATAKEAERVAADPVLEKRVMALAVEMRCLVCQNQTIADSHADLAVDLRNQIRSMLLLGKSEAEIRRYMTDRYGDFVLYNPPMKATTALLWWGPLLLLVGALLALFLLLRRRQRAGPDAFDPDIPDLPDAADGTQPGAR